LLKSTGEGAHAVAVNTQHIVIPVKPGTTRRLQNHEKVVAMIRSFQLKDIKNTTAAKKGEA